MQVKVCDFKSETFREDFIDSVLNTGFAVITNHGIDRQFIKETQDAWRRFFNQSQGYKRRFVNPDDSNLGFTGFGGEKGLGATAADLKEFFHWKPDCELPREVSFVTERMYSLLEEIVAPQLLRALNGLGSTMDYEQVCSGSNNTIFRALYYPAMKDIEVQPGAVRAAAHEDINFITLLVAASAPGLQVQDKNGVWYDVPHEENSIVMNVGDMLQAASGGMLRSTTHRVINPNGDTEDRISIPLFIHPHGDTELVPGKTAQEFLTERLDAIYKAGYKK